MDKNILFSKQDGVGSGRRRSGPIDEQQEELWGVGEQAELDGGVGELPGGVAAAAGRVHAERAAAGRGRRRGSPVGGDRAAADVRSAEEGGAE